MSLPKVKIKQLKKNSERDWHNKMNMDRSLFIRGEIIVILKLQNDDDDDDDDDHHHQ